MRLAADPQFSEERKENITPYFGLVGCSSCPSSSQGTTLIMWIDIKAWPCLYVYSQQEDRLLNFMSWELGSDAGCLRSCHCVPLTPSLWLKAGRSVTEPAKNIRLVSSVPSTYLAAPDWRMLSLACLASSRVTGARDKEELAALRAWEAKQLLGFLCWKRQEKNKVLDLTVPKDACNGGF